MLPLNLNYNYKFKINSDESRKNFSIKFSGNYRVLRNCHYLEHEQNKNFVGNKVDIHPVIKKVDDDYSLFTICNWITSAPIVGNYSAHIMLISTKNRLHLWAQAEDNNVELNQAVIHYSYICIEGENIIAYAQNYDSDSKWACQSKNKQCVCWRTPRGEQCLADEPCFIGDYKSDLEFRRNMERWFNCTSQFPF